MSAPSLRCGDCGRAPSSAAAWRCACGGAFDVVADATDLSVLTIPRGVRGMWRFRAAMRLPSGASPVSLGEGDTPMVPWRRSRFGDRRWLKVESASPTGSFKDRGAAVLASTAIATGARRIVCDSSGNMAASVSAYAAAVGLSCEVFVPAGTSPAKVAQARAYGAHIVEVEGDRDRVADEAQRAVGDAFYASHYWNPFFLEGTKTVAYEIVEALGGAVPDHVIVPVGHGTLWLGLLHGFDELRAAGRTDGIPRLHAIQAMACAPIVAAADGAPVRPPAIGKSRAEGIRVATPPRLAAIVAGLVRTGGRALAVDEAAITAAQAESARAGIWMEPTAAVALAGLHALEAWDLVAPDDVIVTVVTGHGLKSPGTTA